jgi:hypothetical protein
MVSLGCKLLSYLFTVLYKHLLILLLHLSLCFFSQSDMCFADINTGDYNPRQARPSRGEVGPGHKDVMGNA